MILEDVIEEHAEEAAFLWQQREIAVRAPDFDLSDLLEWDERVDAHLDGLRLAGEAGWDIARELGWDLPGEYFTAMSIALMQGRPEWIRAVMDAADEAPEATRGLIAALAWAEAGSLRGLVKQLLETQNPYGRQLGIAACAVHRVHPGQALGEALQGGHPGQLSRALRASGELGLVDQIPQLEKYLEHEDEETRFWAAWSACRLGTTNAASAKILALFAESPCARQREALELLMRILPPEKAQAWLKARLRGRDKLRWALLGAGLQGDPRYLEPLLKQFDNEPVARVAGEAFELITGLNIYENSFEVLDLTETDKAREADMSEDPDEEDDTEALGEDEGLVVPDPEKVRPWLDANRAAFPDGTPLLCGAPNSSEQADDVLRHGRQRQRRVAALSLAVSQPAAALFEVRAPGCRQRRLLASTR